MGKMRILVVVVLAGVVMFCATDAMAQITGSKHDFSDETWSTNDICGPCHIPHNSDHGNGAPLWNHSNTVQSSWTMYDNTNGTQNSSVPTEPASESKACLSCHDGTVSVDAFFGGGPGSVNISTFASGAYTVGAGGALGKDHPISIQYDASLYAADPGLHNPTNIAVQALLIGDTVECSSCHDPHYAGNDNLLRVDNTDSALCLTCHDK